MRDDQDYADWNWRTLQPPISMLLPFHTTTVEMKNLFLFLEKQYYTNADLSFSTEAWHDVYSNQLIDLAKMGHWTPQICSKNPHTLNQLFLGLNGSGVTWSIVDQKPPTNQYFHINLIYLSIILTANILSKFLTKNVSPNKFLPNLTFWVHWSPCFPHVCTHVSPFITNKPLEFPLASTFTPSPAARLNTWTSMKTSLPRVGLKASNPIGCF